MGRYVLSGGRRSSVTPRTLAVFNGVFAAVLVAVIFHGSFAESWQATPSTRVSEISITEDDLAAIGLHERSRRAAVLNRTAVEVSPLAVSVNLNISHLHLMVVWAGQGSPVLFCLGRDTIMKPGATSKVFKSSNHGISYEDITGNFRLENSSQAFITKFYQHPQSNCRFVANDVFNRHVFMTTDCGVTFKSFNLGDIVPSLVEFDKRRDDVFLIHDLESVDKRLYVTNNFGQSFALVQDYVKTFSLKYHANETELFVQRMEPSKDSAVGAIDPERTLIISSTNFFARHRDSKIVYRDAKEFRMIGKYLFVTKVNPEKKDELDLYISSQGDRFVLARFDWAVEKNLSNIDYHIVDVTEDDEILVVVNHNAYLSNLYTSTVINQHEATFTLSLERVMYYSPNKTWHDSWLSATQNDVPFADVYKVQGLRGIYIASQINSDAFVTLSSGGPTRRGESIEPKHLVSLITYNSGSLWSPIRGPSVDEEGRAFTDCAEILDNGNNFSGCSLHLAQQLSKKFPSTRSIPIFTSSTAVGLILGTGNVGKSIKQRSNVFVSADAGLSWHQILKGSYHFSVGDSGGVIVAVKYYKTEGPTNELLYSLNEGKSWEKLTFYQVPMRVFGLLTERGENTTVFTVFGTPIGSGSVDWVVVRIDLKTLFPRDCKEEDYRRWSPSDDSRGKHRNCLLGRKDVFNRRVTDSRCFNGNDRVRQVTTEDCACDRSDYQCDFGFHRTSGWSGPCVPDSRFSDHDLYEPPVWCRPGKFYNQTRGYIKISGDTCIGGKSDVFSPLRVPCPMDNETEFLLVAHRTQILRIDLSNTTHVDYMPLVNGENVITLEYDLQANCIIYGDIEIDKIFIQCLNGSSPRILVENNLSVEGMSFDWIGKTLFFVDGHKRTIELVRTDITYSGRMRKTILAKNKLKKPRGIVVNPNRGILFYSDWDEDHPVIGSANMDGSNVTVIQKSPRVKWPNGLTIDYQSNRLFWVDAQKDLIASCEFDGSDFKIVLEKSPYLVHPFSVTIHKNLLLWNDWDKQAIYMVDKDSGKGAREVIKSLSSSMDIKAFNRLQQTPDSNACSSNPCTHLCVPTSTGKKYNCLCPDGLKRVVKEDDSVHCFCSDLKTEAFKNGTCAMRLENGTLSCNEETDFTCDNKHCIPKLWHCDADDDCGDGSDERGCGLDGGEFTCKTNQFACVKDEKCIPMVWRCDFDNDCSDGLDEKDCNKTTCAPSFRQCENGQCISSKWWCDLEKDCQDGSDEVNCFQASPCKPDEFQCANSTQCMPQSWLCDGESDCPGGTEEKDCTTSHCNDWQFQCGDGQCIFQNWQCDGDSDCMDGSDESNCTEFHDDFHSDKTDFPLPIFPKGPMCSSWMFRCSNENCIPYWWKCDGSPDCADQSDEQGCGEDPLWVHHSDDHDYEDVFHPAEETFCAPTKFSCSTGECIWQAWVCDGQSDCFSGEDELFCENSTKCNPSTEFRCEQSGQCVRYHQVCDGHPDCTDESDEMGCDGSDAHNGHVDTTDKCAGKFRCDFGTCYPESAVCDGHVDCFDGTDEPFDCGYRTDLPKIIGMGPVINEIKNRSIALDWLLSDLAGAGMIEYRPFSSLASDSDNWKGYDWQLLPDMMFVFKDLFPYTRYNFKFSLRRKGTENFIVNSTVVSAVTAPDIPGAPKVVNVTQKQDYVEVVWTPPSQPNGVLVRYIVRVFPLSDNSSLSGRNWTTENAAQTVYVFGALEPDERVGITVRAVNTHFTGIESKPYEFVYKVRNKIKVYGLKTFDAPEAKKVTLAWKIREIPSSNVEYKITVKSNNLIAVHQDVMIQGKDAQPDNDGYIKAVVSDLSPENNYIFGVTVIVDGNPGPFERIDVRTSGNKLPQPKITEANVTPDHGTSIELSWTLSDNVKRPQNWTYGIYYGTSEEEMLLKKVRNTTTETSFVVKNLHACQNYEFVVAIVDARGYGPPSVPFSKMTRYSPGAPPKNLKAELKGDDPLIVNITWQPSCPDTERLSYVITITDAVTKEVTVKKLASRQDTSYNLKLDKGLCFSAEYDITVKTDVQGSTPSQTVHIEMPKIPAPDMLVNHPDLNSSTHVIYWKIPDNKFKGYLKDLFKSNKLTYTVFVSEKPTMENPFKEFNVSTSTLRLPMNELPEGQIFFLSVVISDGLYKSQMAYPIAIESPLGLTDIVVSSPNVAGIVVVIFIIIGSLSAAVVYYYRRNQRLQQRVEEFKSRYSQALGSASIINQYMDDDDEAPIIRGSGDLEPLVR